MINNELVAKLVADRCEHLEEMLNSGKLSLTAYDAADAELATLEAELNGGIQIPEDRPAPSYQSRTECNDMDQTETMDGPDYDDR